MILGDTVSERITTASAGGAIMSPLWLPSLADVSQSCADWAPIIGLAWLVFQFVRALRDEWRKT